MYFSAYYYLGVDLFIILLQSFSIVGNGFIIYLFCCKRRLRKNLSLRLVLTLAITDFLFGISTIPYMLHYLAGWNTVEFSYNGIVVITLSLPLTIQFKINLLITTAIAIDRLQAMRCPVYFRKKRQMRYVYFTVGLGLVLGLLDVFFEYYLHPLKQNVGCAAVGCFTSWEFRIYWGFGNMVFNVIMLVLTIIVAYDVNRLGRKRKQQVDANKSNSYILGNNSDAKKLNQANRLSMGILVISIIFLMVPSTFVGIVDIFGLKSFERLGPFYIFGLLMAGVSNSFVYIIFHVELRMAAKHTIEKYWKGASGITQPSSLDDNGASTARAATIFRTSLPASTRNFSAGLLKPFASQNVPVTTMHTR